VSGLAAVLVVGAFVVGVRLAILFRAWRRYR
jgi:hypothetical protein